MSDELWSALALVLIIEGLLRGLGESIVGHSFGGLIVQMLLDRGLGSAGITIDSAASNSAIRGIRDCAEIVLFG